MVIDMSLDDELKNLSNLCCELVEIASGQFEKNVSQIDTHEMGEVVDMIKDLSEAKRNTADAFYRKSIVEAMEKSDGSQTDYVLGVEAYKSATASELRDMDKANGKMYYTEMPIESKYEKTKTAFADSKSDNSDTSMQMKALEDYFGVVAEDMSSLLPVLNSNEKQMLRQKMQVLMQRLA